MTTEYIITMTAANRVGILASVTTALGELGAELREASQTVVRGYFTMIFSAEFPDNMGAQLISDHLQDACRLFDIQLSVNEAAGLRIGESGGNSLRHYSLRLGGDNQKGVLKQLSAALSRNQIDIAGMNAVRTRGGKGFEMVMKIAVPAEFDLDRLVKNLNDVGRSFNITAEVAPYS